MSSFSDQLVSAILDRQSAFVVGLDPSPDLLPPSIRSSPSTGPISLEADAKAVFAFNCQIIDAVHDLVVAVKPQSAFYERLGVPGVQALSDTIEYARQAGLLVILDAKRNDIGSTAAAYAEAYLGGDAGSKRERTRTIFGVDALTVNPYLGSDGVLPFTQAAAQFGRGVFVLVQTSNPSAVELQDLRIEQCGAASMTLAQVVAGMVAEWAAPLVGKSGYSSVGAVVGATFPEQARSFREIMPQSFFLVPGVGSQGGNPADLEPFFNEDGLGAIVSASRSVIYAYRDRKWSHLTFATAARNATAELRDVVEKIRNRR